MALNTSKYNHLTAVL